MMEKHEDGLGALYSTLCETEIRSLGHDSSLCVFISVCVRVLEGGWDGCFESRRLENWSERYAVRC